MTEEEIADFCLKKTPTEELEKEAKIPTLAETKSAFKVIYDRLSQSIDENKLEILTKLEDVLN